MGVSGLAPLWPASLLPRDTLALGPSPRLQEQQWIALSRSKDRLGRAQLLQALGLPAG